jgi:hypothetical protein
MQIKGTKVEQIVREMEAAADELVWDRMTPSDRGHLAGRVIILAGELRTEIARQELRVVHLAGAMQ